MNGYNFSDASDIRLGSSTITALYYGTTLIWPKSTPPTPTDWSTEYLQVEALEPLNLTTNMSVSKTSTDILDVQYSTDKTTWYTWNEDISISMNTGDIVYFKGSYIWNDNVAGNNTLITTADKMFNIKGNIMSLIYGDNFILNQSSLLGYNNCFRSLFENSKVINANNLILPATTLEDFCYYYMFNGCSSLVNTPILPATIMKWWCYGSMFMGCSSLTTAPLLPATTLATRCYSAMFNGCTSLTTAPSLTATILEVGCYNSMFYGCTSLETAPELPATTLADDCYQNMFEDCSSLTTAPSLPATTLKEKCYNYMFAHCTSLETAPELPANTLVTDCYDNMFDGCTSLNYIKCLATSWNTSYATVWVRNVAASGTFIKYTNTNIPVGGGSTGIPLGWTVTDPATEHWSNEYLQVEALEPMTLTTSIPVSKTTNDILDVQYSTDKTNWNAWNEDVSLSLSTGDKVYFKGSYLATFTKINSTNSYSAKYKLCGNDGGRYNVQGNIMSLIYGDNFANQYSLQGYTYCFYKLFMSNKSITDMSNLILPATELAKQCYIYMFNGCTSLTTAPALPATTLVDYCYSNMFNGCTSLTTAPALPATTLKTNCYTQMFNGCTSLTTAPELPATKLTGRCYYQMFRGCTSLNYIKCLATDMTAAYCLTDWVTNVAATGTFVKDANATWASGTSGIPSGWTVQDM